jgi:molecular chaperone HtpG
LPAAKYELKTIPLSITDPFVTINLPEFERRMKEMQAMRGGEMSFMGAFPEKYHVVVNTNHPLASKIADGKIDAEKEAVAKQAIDLALLSQNMLSGQELSDFISRSIDLMVTKM